MTKSEILTLQQELLEQGFYDGIVDGIWGPKSRSALEAAAAALTLRQQCECPSSVPAGGPRMAWGAKVSAAFRDRIRWMRDDLRMPSDGADWLMSCIAWESNETFSPSVKNMAGSGATGLIQFMPRTAEGLGTTTEQLSRMTAEDQLSYVYKHFRPFRGRLNSLSDVYMAILWPVAVGKPESHVLWSQAARPTTYRQNSGLDVNRDGSITKAEAASKVAEKLAKGRRPDLLG